MSPVARQRIASKALSGQIAGNGGVLDLETIPFASFVSTEYLINISSETESKFYTLKLIATKKNSDVSDQIYNKEGDLLQIATNVIKSGSDVILRLVNDEIYQVDVRCTKTTV
jgi:hypothetical protein